MSSTHAVHPFPPVLVRGDEAEHLELIGHVLLADSSATGGALSSHRVALGRGADGAVPHRHDNSSELFYILDGALDLLVRDDIVTAHTGDLLVVPPGSAHAFAAHRDSTAEALIMATPGIERFDYFRQSSAAGRASSRPGCCSDCRTASTPTFSTVPFGGAPAPPLDAMTTGLTDRQYPVRPRGQSQAGFTSINSNATDAAAESRKAR